VQVPHRILVSSGNVKYDTTLTLTRASFGPAQPDAAFAIPAVTKLDFTLRGGVRQTTIPFQLINNHIYADVWLNGKGPYRMLVDTGGVNIVTPTLARALGLETQGQMEGGGAGEGRVDVSLTKMNEVRIGDAVITDQIFAVFPLESFADVEGVPQHGIVGYEVFRRFVAQVDYGKSLLTLIDPKHFSPLRACKVVPFVFSGHIPSVRGTIDGMPGEFHIDTGARSELVLTRPFATANNLRAKYRRGVDAVSGWGVGGPSRGYVTRMESLKIGEIEFERPITTFSTSERGAFAHATYAGNIGSGLMKEYVVTFDYGNQKLYFAPGGVRERDGYDRTGMWINRSPEGFAIVDVTPRSPAAIAGIRNGDTIVSIDGKRASELSLIDVRRWFRSQAAGTVFHLGIRRGSATTDYAITLRNLI
jgi:predicted aspartyl protease